MEETEHACEKRIKYCGNCNPEIHPKQIRNVVEKIAAKKGPGVLVLVNGCSRECLTKNKVAYQDRTTMSLNAGELIMLCEESGKEG